jgi:hypothetical protein
MMTQIDLPRHLCLELPRIDIAMGAMATNLEFLAQWPCRDGVPGTGMIGQEEADGGLLQERSEEV